MDHIRYLLGELALVVCAPGLLFWLFIHPWAHRWRVLGPSRTYFIVFAMLAGLSLLLFQVRRTLLGTDLGTNWILIGVALLAYVILVWLGLTYGRDVSHLSLAVRMGVPELSRSNGRQILLREGIYRGVRHPVYLTAEVAGISFALVVNYVGMYILFVSAIPVLYVTTILEERELIARFGDEYRRYQREVPRLIPRWQAICRNEPAR
jgi:protein-S-isoprenylcysteine O-methyltransferase Ste14